MPKKQKLFSIDEVQISISKSAPLLAMINVSGYAATAGWSNADLVPLEKELSADGILDLEFVAEPPKSNVGQVLTRMSANIIWEHDVDRLVGAKIYSRTGDVLELINDELKVALPDNTAGLTPLPWPEPYPWPQPLPFPWPPQPKPIPWPPRWPTSRAIGEEGLPTLRRPFGEGATTLAIGEEGTKTQLWPGENDPYKPYYGETDPRADDPAGPFSEDRDFFDPDDFSVFGRR